MYTASNRVQVDAPIERVLEFLEEPHNHVKMTPGLLSIETTADDGGWQGRYVYKLAGVRLEGTVREVERDPPSRLVHELSGAIDGRLFATLAETDDGDATIEYSVEYDLPGTVLAAVPEATATGYVSRDLECTLANLKTHLEATETPNR